MTTTEKIQMITDLFKSNLGISSNQIMYRKEADISAFYITIGETITAVLFPLKTIEKLDLDKIPDYFKNKIKLYESIRDTGIRITIDDNIAIWPNHPPLDSI